MVLLSQELRKIFSIACLLNDMRTKYWTHQVDLIQRCRYKDLMLDIQFHTHAKCPVPPSYSPFNAVFPCTLLQKTVKRVRHCLSGVPAARPGHPEGDRLVREVHLTAELMVAAARSVPHNSSSSSSNCSSSMYSLTE